MAPSRTDIKWTVFQVISYLQVAAAVVMIILPVASGGLPTADFVDILSFSLYILFFSAIAANAFSNLYLLQRFFPDRLPPKAASRFNMVLYILNLITSAALIIALVAITTDWLDVESGRRDYPIIPYIGFATLALTSICVWFLQPSLRNTLKRNYYRVFDQFLEPENP